MINLLKRPALVLSIIQLCAGSAAWAEKVAKSTNVGNAEAPCYPGSVNDKWRTCEKVIHKKVNLDGSSETGAYSAEEHMAGTLQQVNENIRLQMATYLKGNYLSETGKGESVDGKVCNSTDNDFVPTKTGSCGNTAFVRVQPGLTTFVHTQGYGTWEDGVLRGAYIAANACFYKEVTDKLNGGGVASVPIVEPCAMLLSKFNEQKSKFLSSPSVEFVKPGNCPEDSEKLQNGSIRYLTLGQAVKEDNADTTNFGARNQNCAYLRAQRSAIEALFADVITCDVNARSYVAFHNNVTDKEAHKKIFDKLNKIIYPKCQGQCMPLFDPTDPDSMDSVQQCATSCYGEAVKEELPKIIEDMWPKDGPCKASLGFPAFFAIGSLRRRKKKSDPRKQTGRDLGIGRISLIFALAGSAVHLFSACSQPPAGGATDAAVAHGDTPMPGANLPAPGKLAIDKGLHDYNSANSADTNARDENSTKPGTNGTIAKTDGAAAGAPNPNDSSGQGPSGGVNGSYANAPNLLGGTGTVDPFASNGMDHFSAVDGGIKNGVNTAGSGPGGKGNNGGKGLDVGNLLKNNGLVSPKGGAGGSSGGGSGQLGSSGGPGAGGIGGDPNAPGAGGPLDGPGSLKNDAIGAAFAGGGGAGGSGGRSGDGSNPFDVGGGAGGAGAGGRLDFNSNGTRALASNGADRADYLSLIDPKDSIFKVVHRRYEKTTIAWRREATTKH